MASLARIIPQNNFDNDLIADASEIFEPEKLGHRKPQQMYIGKLNNRPSIFAIPVTARNGYSGDIDILVGITYQGKITAVEIIDHKETPGLGDLIERQKSNWLEQFPGKSLKNPPEPLWKVKKDQGDFDQITAATITPRAVVAAIKRALQYHKNIVIMDQAS